MVYITTVTLDPNEVKPNGYREFSIEFRGESKKIYHTRMEFMSLNLDSLIKDLNSLDYNQILEVSIRKDKNIRIVE